VALTRHSQVSSALGGQERIVKSIWASLLVTLSLPVLAAGKSACVLPVADGQGPTPSEPSFRGEIVKVGGGLVTVGAESGSRHIEFQVNDKTKLFTVYGGVVSKQELVAGIKASVWYVGCDASKAGSPPVAAVVILDSTR
jgi:hypothetical protein